MRALGGHWTAVCDLFSAVPAQGAVHHPAVPVAASEDAGGFARRLSTRVLQRRGRLVAACLATVLGPAVVAQAGSLGAQPASAVRPVEDPATAPLTTPVPGDTASWLPLARQAAATCPGLPSAVLVAIGDVETNLGLLEGTSSAGALGPMQFLPSTWSAYGTDGDGDGLVDVMNPADAVHGAARLLCANGGADPQQLPSAIWNYNHSDDYVRRVLGVARFIPTGP